MPRANNLKGEYCQTCAETLDEHQRDPKDVIALCNECLKVFKASGDHETIRNGGASKEEKKEPEKKGFVDRVKSKTKELVGD